jgi:hypothetical protein
MQCRFLTHVSSAAEWHARANSRTFLPQRKWTYDESGISCNEQGTRHSPSPQRLPHTAAHPSDSSKHSSMSLIRGKTSPHGSLQSQVQMGWKGEILRGFRRQESSDSSANDEAMNVSMYAPEVRGAKAEWKALSNMSLFHDNVWQSSMVAHVHETLQQKGIRPSKARMHRNLVRACEILYG